MQMEFTYLLYSLILLLVMWLPYIINTVMIRGLAQAMGYPAQPKPLSPWASRLKAAHYNMVENMVIFAPLVLLLAQLEGFTAATAQATVVFFWARLAYAVIYAVGIPYLRTLVFATAWVATVVLAWRACELLA